MNLTALIACQDRKRNLDYCLASMSLCKPIPQCIVVDYGSVDPIHYPEYSAWLRVIRVNDSGIFNKSRAMNIALRHTTTDYICSTDADQIFNKNFFGTVLNFLTKYKNRIVLCKTYLATSLYRVTLNDFIKKNGYTTMLNNVRKERRRTIGEGCCNGMPTSWILSVNGWDEDYVGWGYEDTDLLLRASLSGIHTSYIDHKTNMIHLPHTRTTAYYSNKYIGSNRSRLAKKKMVMHGKKNLIVVNKSRLWGQLV